MPRRRDELGVGRGNGAGSRRSQFKDGQPSGNPKGRPRKPRPTPTDTMGQTLARLLAETVPVDLGNGHIKRMRRMDALGKNMVQQLPNAPLRDQLAFFRLIGGFEAPIVPPYVMPQRTIEDLIYELAKDAEKAGHHIDWPDERR